MLKWPDAQLVDRTVRDWANQVIEMRPDVVRLGYFGSYAKGDWGVGSDLDLIVVLEDSVVPFERRGLEWDLTNLPVPAEILVYTEQEWRALGAESRFRRTIEREGVWLFQRESGTGS